MPCKKQVKLGNTRCFGSTIITIRSYLFANALESKQQKTLIKDSHKTISNELMQKIRITASSTF